MEETLWNSLFHLVLLTEVPPFSPSSPAPFCGQNDPADSLDQNRGVVSQGMFHCPHETKPIFPKLLTKQAMNIH